MPRIDAPTVAEHRDRQRRALLDAARALLAEGSGEAPGLAAVAARAGMSRTAVYQYFRSRDDLLDAVVEDTFPRWLRRLDDALAGAAAPADRVLAYVDVNLALVAEGEHALAQALRRTVTGERARTMAAHSAALHDRLRAPLVEALGELGADDVDLAAELVGSLVYRASVALEEGADPAVVRGQVVAMLEPWLTAPAAPRRRPAASRR